MGKRAVFDSLPIHDDLHDQCGTLCEKRGETQRQDVFYDGKTKPHILLFHCQCAEFFQIEQTEDKGAELTDDSGKGSSLNAPVENKDKQGVQYTVKHSANQHGPHGVARVAVGTDFIVDHDTYAGKHGAQ